MPIHKWPPRANQEFSPSWWKSGPENGGCVCSPAPLARTDFARYLHSKNSALTLAVPFERDSSPAKQMPSKATGILALCDERYSRMSCFSAWALQMLGHVYEAPPRPPIISKYIYIYIIYIRGKVRHYQSNTESEPHTLKITLGHSFA